MEPPHIRGETPRDHNGIPYNNVILYGSGRKEKRLCCGKVTSLTAVFYLKKKHLLTVRIQHEPQVKQQYIGEDPSVKL